MGIPVAAALTVAHRGANAEAPLLLEQRPEAVCYVLEDTHSNTPELRQECHQRGWEWVDTRRGPYPHRNRGAEVRKVFHTRRSKASESFNGLFKNIFEWRMKIPVKDLRWSQLLALDAVVSYQLVCSISMSGISLWGRDQAAIKGSRIYDHVSANYQVAHKPIFSRENSS